VKIKVERSGGFAGISSSNEIDAEELPLSLEGTLQKLLDKKKVPMSKNFKRSKGAADYLNYKITIRDGKKDHVTECNELEMDNSLKSLVNYVQKNSEIK
jgi:hypothetical protein